MHNNALRSEIYLLLSEGFKKPTAAFTEEQPAVVEFLHESLAALGYQIPGHLYQHWPELAGNLQDLQAAHQRSFVFPVHSRVLPVESIYRRWTYDDTGNVPFSSEKGFLLSDHALHLRALYQIYGISIPDEFQSMPDHICLELEFASFLLNHETPDRSAVFIQEHLSWLEDLYQVAISADIPIYYRQLIELTAMFIENELSYVQNFKP